MPTSGAGTCGLTPAELELFYEDLVSFVVGGGRTLLEIVLQRFWRDAHVGLAGVVGASGPTG